MGPACRPRSAGAGGTSTGRSTAKWAWRPAAKPRCVRPPPLRSDRSGREPDHRHSSCRPGHRVSVRATFKRHGLRSVSRPPLAQPPRPEGSRPSATGAAAKSPPVSVFTGDVDRQAPPTTYTFVVVALLIIVLGIVSTQRIATDIFPDVDFPEASVHLGCHRDLTGGRAQASLIVSRSRRRRLKARPGRAAFANTHRGERGSAPAGRHAVPRDRSRWLASLFISRSAASPRRWVMGRGLRMEGSP